MKSKKIGTGQYLYRDYLIERVYFSNNTNRFMWHGIDPNNNDVLFEGKTKTYVMNCINGFIYEGKNGCKVSLHYTKDPSPIIEDIRRFTEMTYKELLCAEKLLLRMSMDSIYNTILLSWVLSLLEIAEKKNRKPKKKVKL